MSGQALNKVPDVQITSKSPKRYLLLPVDLMQYVLCKKLARPFQLFVLLKGSCSGKIRLTSEMIKQFCQILGIKSEKTIHNNLRLLQQWNWIGYNRRSGYYFIRSFGYVKSIENLNYKTAAEFDLSKIKFLKPFMVSAVIGKIIRHKTWKKRESERNNGRSNQTSTTQVYLPFACSYLSQILGVSLSSAHEYKQQAAANGFIRINPSHVALFRNREQRLEVQNLKLAKLAYPEVANRMRSYRGNVYMQAEDHVAVIELRLKRKKY